MNRFHGPVVLLTLTLHVMNPILCWGVWGVFSGGELWGAVGGGAVGGCGGLWGAVGPSMSHHLISLFHHNIDQCSEWKYSLSESMKHPV